MLIVWITQSSYGGGSRAHRCIVEKIRWSSGALRSGKQFSSKQVTGCRLTIEKNLFDTYHKYIYLSKCEQLTAIRHALLKPVYLKMVARACLAATYLCFCHWSMNVRKNISPDKKVFFSSTENIPSIQAEAAFDHQCKERQDRSIHLHLVCRWKSKASYSMCTQITSGA